MPPTARRACRSTKHLQYNPLKLKYPGPDGSAHTEVLPETQPGTQPGTQPETRPNTRAAIVGAAYFCHKKRIPFTIRELSQVFGPPESVVYSILASHNLFPLNVRGGPNPRGRRRGSTREDVDDVSDAEETSGADEDDDEDIVADAEDDVEDVAAETVADTIVKGKRKSPTGSEAEASSVRKACRSSTKH